MSEYPTIRRNASAGIEDDQQQYLRCQRGEHDMLATATPGVVVCRLCRTLGVCLWCGFSLPQGACITVCVRHIGTVQHQGLPRQSRRPASAAAHTTDR